MTAILVKQGCKSRIHGGLDDAALIRDRQLMK
jgi:hypothetical protein